MRTDVLVREYVIAMSYDEAFEWPITFTDGELAAARVFEFS
jgi:hypothetical protein